MIQYLKLLNDERSIIETGNPSRAELNPGSAKLSADKTYSKDTETVLRPHTYQAGFQCSDIQRHVTGIYLTVHRYWILPSSQYCECWNFFFLEIQCFLLFSAFKANVFICTDVSPYIIQYLLQPTHSIAIPFLSIACHKHGTVLHQDTRFPSSDTFQIPG